MLMLVVRLSPTRVLMARGAGLMTLSRCPRAWTLYRLWDPPLTRGLCRMANPLTPPGSGTGLCIRVLACPVAPMTLSASVLSMWQLNVPSWT